MKKNQKAPRKLTLNRETLRSLEEEHLREVAGGASALTTCSLVLCGTLECESRKTC
jgi:hypothetical protein